MTEPIDLYAVLGVGRTARPATIKRAYRKKARLHHPDRNPGDEDAARRFQVVQLAWEVLGDSLRRAHYDATGETGAAPDNTSGEAIALLMRVFHGIMGRLDSTGRDPMRVDLVTLMKDDLNGNIRTKQQAIRDVEKTLVKLRAVAERFERTAPGDNFMQTIALAPVANAEQSLQLVRREVERMELALTLLADFRFRMDTMPNGMFRPLWIPITMRAGKPGEY